MSEQQSFRDIRVFYTRKGPVKYLSHLDVNRCMQRALARSGLPVWYTQGFNPHLYVTFAMPTPLGYESDCETMDLRLVEETPMDEVRDRLNAALPQGFRVLRAAPPVRAAEEIVRADYDLRVSAPGKTAGELRALFGAFFARDSIPVQKKTKKGSKEVDLKPLAEPLAMEEGEGGSLLLKLRLAAGPSVNVSPSLLLEAFGALTGAQLDCPGVVKRAVYAAGPGHDEIFA